MARANRTDKLARLAKPLRPTRAPWFQADAPPGLEAAFPAPGWYWVPAGAQVAEWLARDYVEAYHRLRRLIEDQEARP